MRWLAAVSLVALAGCPTGDDDILWLDERFEDEAALREAWTISGTFELPSTIHPGEHALMAIDGPISMTHALSLVVWDELSDGEWIEYSTPCLGAPTVWFESEVDSTIHVFAQIPSELPDDQPEWDRVYANVPPLPLGVTITALTVFFDGGNVCAIDNLRFYQPQNEYGY